MYVEYARKHANLFLEICHSGSRYRIIEFFVHAVGADRILFGSDIPVMSLEHAIGRIIFSDISEDEALKILVENAQRLLEGIKL